MRAKLKDGEDEIRMLEDQNLALKRAKENETSKIEMKHQSRKSWFGK